MLKIETAVRVTDEFPAGRSGEFIWMIGQQWPVPRGLDEDVQRIEAFGDELAEIANKVEGGATADVQLPAEGTAVVRTWYRANAANLSRAMRKVYGSA